jgi:hypothetical protein
MRSVIRMPRSTTTESILNPELEVKILQRVWDMFATGQVKMMYFRQCGIAPTGIGGIINLHSEDREALLSAKLGDSFSREVTLPSVFYEDWLHNPYIAPACNRRISRTWCNGQCIGQRCIFWGSSGIGTINLERTSIEEEA